MQYWGTYKGNHMHRKLSARNKEKYFYRRSQRGFVVYQGKRVVALLPMKAHSERVVGKNFRNLAGQPLFRWIMNTLLSIRSGGLGSNQYRRQRNLEGARA